MAVNPKIKVAQLIVKKVVGLKFKIIQTLDQLLSKFVTGCPSDAEIAKIIKKRNQTAELINQIRKAINQIDLLIKPIEVAIPVVENTVVTVLKTNPAPSAAGGVGVPIGLIVTAADSLSIAKNKIEEYKSVLEMFKQIKELIVDILAAVVEKLKQLDTLIQDCASKNATKKASEQLAAAQEAASKSGESVETELSKLTNNNQLTSGGQPGTENDILLEINSLINIEDNNIIKNLQSSTPNSDNTYKGFKLEILLDDKNDLRFPKRYAVAKTPNGVIVLRTESSFASSVNVLLEEIKFIIDRDNLKV